MEVVLHLQKVLIFPLFTENRVTGLMKIFTHADVIAPCLCMLEGETPPHIKMSGGKLDQASANIFPKPLRSQKFQKPRTPFEHKILVWLNIAYIHSACNAKRQHTQFARINSD